MKNELRLKNNLWKIFESKLKELEENDIEELIEKDVNLTKGEITFIAKQGRFKREKYKLNISLSKTD